MSSPEREGEEEEELDEDDDYDEEYDDDCEGEFDPECDDPFVVDSSDSGQEESEHSQSKDAAKEEAQSNALGDECTENGRVERGNESGEDRGNSNKLTEYDEYLYYVELALKEEEKKRERPIDSILLENGLIIEEGETYDARISVDSNTTEFEQTSTAKVVIPPQSDEKVFQVKSDEKLVSGTEMKDEIQTSHVFETTQEISKVHEVKPLEQPPKEVITEPVSSEVSSQKSEEISKQTQISGTISTEDIDLIRIRLVEPKDEAKKARSEEEKKRKKMLEWIQQNVVLPKEDMDILRNWKEMSWEKLVSRTTNLQEIGVSASGVAILDYEAQSMKETFAQRKKKKRRKLKEDLFSVRNDDPTGSEAANTEEKDSEKKVSSDATETEQPKTAAKRKFREKLAARKLVGQSFVTQTPFFSTNDLELEVDQGEDVTILEQDEFGWVKAISEATKKSGWVHQSVLFPSMNSESSLNLNEKPTEMDSENDFSKSADMDFAFGKEDISHSHDGNKGTTNASDLEKLSKKDEIIEDLKQFSVSLESRSSRPNQLSQNRPSRLSVFTDKSEKYDSVHHLSRLKNKEIPGEWTTAKVKGSSSFAINGPNQADSKWRMSKPRMAGPLSINRAGASFNIANTSAPECADSNSPISSNTPTKRGYFSTSGRTVQRKDDEKGPSSLSSTQDIASSSSSAIPSDLTNSLTSSPSFESLPSSSSSQPRNTSFSSTNGSNVSKDQLYSIQHSYTFTSSKLKEAIESSLLGLSRNQGVPSSTTSSNVEQEKAIASQCQEEKSAAKEEKDAEKSSLPLPSTADSQDGSEKDIVHADVPQTTISSEELFLVDRKDSTKSKFESNKSFDSNLADSVQEDAQHQLSEPFLNDSINISAVELEKERNEPTSPPLPDQSTESLQKENSLSPKSPRDIQSLSPSSSLISPKRGNTESKPHTLASRPSFSPRSSLPVEDTSSRKEKSKGSKQITPSSVSSISRKKTREKKGSLIQLDNGDNDGSHSFGNQEQLSSRRTATDKERKGSSKYDNRRSIQVPREASPRLVARLADLNESEGLSKSTESLAPQKLPASPSSDLMEMSSEEKRNENETTPQRPKGKQQQKTSPQKGGTSPHQITLGNKRAGGVAVGSGGGDSGGPSSAGSRDISPDRRSRVPLSLTPLSSSSASSPSSWTKFEKKREGDEEVDSFLSETRDVRQDDSNLMETLRQWSVQVQNSRFQFVPRLLIVHTSFHSDKKGAISLESGDFVTFLALSPNGWVKVKKQEVGEEGWVPVDHLQVMSAGCKNLRTQFPELTKSATEVDLGESELPSPRKKEDSRMDYLLQKRPTVLHLNVDKILTPKDIEAILKTEKKKANHPAVPFFRNTNLKVFGGTIEKICDVTGDVIPHIVSECVLYLTQTALNRQGIFRVSGVFEEVVRLKTLFNDTKKISLKKLRSDPHAVSNVLKSFFAELAEPCIPRSLYVRFVECHKDLAENIPKRNDTYKVLLEQLPTSPRLTLYVLLQFLHKIHQNAEKNLMDSNNLGIVFGPNLLRPVGEDGSALRDLSLPAAVVADLIEYFPDIKTAMERKDGAAE